MKFILTILLLASINAFSQISDAGTVLNAKDRRPVAYAKIGVEGRGVGTVADENGNFALVINYNIYGKDIIRFSCPGYVPYSVRVSDYQHMENKIILLQEKNIAPAPVKQVPANAKMKTYGVAGNNDIIEINGGLPGSEVGLIFNFKESSLLNKLTVKFESCSVDTIFYRVNVYDVAGNMNFQNILNKPIYYKIPAGELENRALSIDLSQENIWVKGSKLITIEQVRSYNTGIIRFTGTKNGKSYGRKASFGAWKIIPTTISMQVEATTGK